jgi:ankyrin repeat protein
MRSTGYKVVLGALLLVLSGTGTPAAAQGAYGEAVTPDGTTPLHQAVRQNDIKTADALIKRGADVKATTRYGITPIGLAALNGNAAMLRRLLDAGADPDTATPGGETALMTAARTGNVDAVTLLLDRRANVNAKDTARAQTALMWAVTENHPDIVKLLVARGANVNAQTIVSIPKGEYVPARAGGASGPGIIRQRALPKADGGMSSLLFAVRDGNTEMTRLLLELGADITPHPAITRRRCSSRC